MVLLVDHFELQHFIELLLVFTVLKVHPGIRDILLVDDGITCVILFFDYQPGKDRFGSVRLVVMLILHQLLHLLSKYNRYAIKVKRVTLGHISLLTAETG